MSNSDEVAHHALSTWDDFPVPADPRPLVITGPTTLFRGGFPTNGLKHAYLRGNVEAVVDVPEDVLRALAPRNDAMPECPDVLQVVEAGREEALFDTDRGPRALPAWRLKVADVAEPFFVLDPETARDAWWTGADGVTDMSARSDAEGRVLTVEFTGSPERDTDYPECVVLETATAVTAVPVSVDLATGGFQTFLVLQRREVTAHLTAPLGARVFVDHANGRPVPVTASDR